MKFLFANLLLSSAVFTPLVTGHANSQARAEGSNRSFSHQITTTAAPSQIWKVWMDVANWKDWDLGLKDASSDGPLKHGATGMIVPRRGSASQFTITEFEFQNAYTFETDLPAAKLIVEREIIKTNPTTIEHRVRFTGRLSGVWALALGPGFRRALPPTMDRLAEIAEGKQ